MSGENTFVKFIYSEKAQKQDWKVFQPHRLRNKWPILHIYSEAWFVKRVNKDFNNEFALKWRQRQDNNKNDGLLRLRSRCAA